MARDETLRWHGTRPFVGTGQEEVTDPKASDPKEDPKVKVVDMPSMICQLAVLDVALQATNATSLWTTQNSSAPLVTKTYLQGRYQVLPPFENDTANA